MIKLYVISLVDMLTCTYELAYTWSFKSLSLLIIK